MPRAPKYKPICCQYFTWRLFQRDGVWYADGRAAQHDLGKHSLGTRDHQQALADLRQLDAQIAIQQGRATPETVVLPEDISIGDGWRLYLENCGRSQGMGGVAPTSLQRYQSIRDKHLPWCRSKGIETWRQFDRKTFEKYGDWMFKNYAYRTCYTDLTQIKSVVKWLIDEQRLPEGSRIVYKLQKPEGSDTYCPRPVEVRAMIDLCLARPGWSGWGMCCSGWRIWESASASWPPCAGRTLILPRGLSALPMSAPAARRLRREQRERPRAAALALSRFTRNSRRSY
jgi:hypothetical protein